ncbi:hypothetical protein [Oleiharenicola sp. Vm1]|uniref:hypothetical protein n=1 Tax=Oleiharenicola sp. Vm1 TaxID=3398393 RepID=UPI0039F4C10A
MLRRLVPFVLLVLGCASLAPLARAQAAAAAAPAPAAPSPADRDYEAVWAIYRAAPPAGVEHPSQEFFRWQDRQFQEFAAAARAFGEKYPHDPRRYEGWVQASFTGPSFIVDFKPEFADKPNGGNVVTDRDATLRYRSEQVRLLELVVVAADANARQRNGAFYALLIDAGTVARLKGEKFDVTALRPWSTACSRSFPTSAPCPSPNSMPAGCGRSPPPRRRRSRPRSNRIR